MLSNLEQQPADALLALIKLYAADSRADKIDLGVGVYRTDDGATPVFGAIKAAEKRLLETQDSKAYLGPEGDMGFVHALMPYVFGAEDPTMGGRIEGMQTLPRWAGRAGVARRIGDADVERATVTRHAPVDAAIGGAAAGLVRPDKLAVVGIERPDDAGFLAGDDEFGSVLSLDQHGGGAEVVVGAVILAGPVAVGGATAAGVVPDIGLGGLEHPAHLAGVDVGWHRNPEQVHTIKCQFDPHGRIEPLHDLAGSP